MARHDRVKNITPIHNRKIMLRHSDAYEFCILCRISTILRIISN